MKSAIASVIGLGTAVFVLQSAGAASGACGESSVRVREIAAYLPSKPALSDVRHVPNGEAADVPVAEKLLGKPVEPFPDDLYREFSVNGNRTHYEGWNIRFRKELALLASAELAERRGRFLPAIVARLEAICTWPSWVWPAHDPGRVVVEGRSQLVDLISSEQARLLAGILSSLGDRLPPETVARVRAETERRVFRPYLETPEKLWWFLGHNNWNAVCHAGCVIAALALVDDPVTRARFVEGAERGSLVYLDKGFTPDGYCSEGMSYWNYGFGHFIDLGLAVRGATGGKVDFFDHPKAAKIMRYAAAYQLVRGVSPKFADGSRNPAEAIVARGLSVWPELRPEFEGALPLRSVFPDGQVWLMRLAADDPARFALALKGGHNKEFHNHNDVGSYCVMAGGQIVAGDVGGEVYTARTFSNRRYESKVINSYGHPVPRVDGKLQPKGRQYAAKVLKTDFTDARDTVVLDLAGAYDCPALKKLVRTFVFDRTAKTATVTDSVAFSAPTAFESPYLTVVPEALKGRVTVSAAGGAWTTEKETLENPDRPTPHRIAVRFREPVTEATVTFVFSATTLASAAGNADAGVEEGGIAIPPKPASSDGQIVVFEDEVTGRISPQNGVCGAPDKPGTANFAAWKAAEFPYSRTHDLNLCATYGAPYVIDVPWIFRDFDADENDPKNYDFACTDDILRRIREVGVEPFYRLGGAYENYLVKHYNVFPPKDFAKWARICEHIIAHYTEGWADGYKWKMEHWEIWNEPNLRTGADNGANGPFWRGPRDQFKELWKTAQKHLKARFPHLKFGGAAFAGTGGDWGAAMVKEFAAEKVPLDFYSWHTYATDPSTYGKHARWVRRMLDSNGYTNTLSVIDEWNYVKGWDVHARGSYSRNVWLGDKNDKCAAFIAASMIELDAAGVDIGMFYDARKPGMNALFNQIDGQPKRGYYPFIAWRNLRRLGTRVKTTSEFKDDVWTVAAKGADGKLGMLVARYTDDDNAFRPKRVTLRLASGKDLKNAVCHLTDRNFIHTAYDPEPNADGSIDLTMAPCSFAYVEVAP